MVLKKFKKLRFVLSRNFIFIQRDPTYKFKNCLSPKLWYAPILIVWAENFKLFQILFHYKILYPRFYHEDWSHNNVAMLWGRPNLRVPISTMGWNHKADIQICSFSPAYGIDKIKSLVNAKDQLGIVEACSNIGQCWE